MTFLFYLIFLIAGLIREISVIHRPSSVLERKEEYKNYKALDPETQKLQKLPISGWDIAYLLLSIVGILSSQWLLFIVLLGLGLIPKTWKPWIFVDAVLSLFLVLFIVINRYHLHIPLWEVLNSSF